MIAMARVKPTSTVVAHLVADTSNVEVTREEEDPVLNKKLDKIPSTRASINPCLEHPNQLCTTKCKTMLSPAPKSSSARCVLPTSSLKTTDSDVSRCVDFLSLLMFAKSEISSATSEWLNVTLSLTNKMAPPLGMHSCSLKVKRRHSAQRRLWTDSSLARDMWMYFSPR